MNAARIAFVALALAGCAGVEKPAPVPVEPSREPVSPPARAPARPPAEAPRSQAETPRSPVLEPAARPTEAESLIAEFQRLRRLSGNELAREQDAARQGFNQSRSDAARVRLAMTLALPGSPANEESRALELLDPLVRNPGSALYGLALLMASYIQEQRRLGGQVQALQQNMHGMQQKLDALKSLERSLSERGEGGAARRR